MTPCMEYNGQIMTDSREIMNFLVEKHAEKLEKKDLLPKDEETRKKV